jgi:hypothetical protein
MEETYKNLEAKSMKPTLLYARIIANIIMQTTVLMPHRILLHQKLMTRPGDERKKSFSGYLRCPCTTRAATGLNTRPMAAKHSPVQVLRVQRVPPNTYMHLLLLVQAMYLPYQPTSQPAPHLRRYNHQPLDLKQPSPQGPKRLHLKCLHPQMQVLLSSHVYGHCILSNQQKPENSRSRKEILLRLLTEATRTGGVVSSRDELVFSLSTML